MNRKSDNHDNLNKSRKNEAMEFMRKGDYNSAEMIYRGILINNRKDYIVLGNLAIIRGIRGDMKEMINFLKEAIIIKPDSAPLHNNLGNALKNLGDTNNAIDYYEKAIKLKPDYSEAYNNLGIALQQEGLIHDAILSYKNALKFKSMYAEALYNLGNAYREIKSYIESIEAYKKAIKFNPNLKLIYYNLAITYQEKGDIKNSIFFYKRELNKNPDCEEVLNNLGTALQEHGEFNSSLATYEKVLELNPKCAEALNNIGYLNKELGDLNNAIKFYQKALDVNPDYAEAHWNYASALLLTGDYNLGWKEFEWRFRRKNPTTTHAQPNCELWRGEIIKGKEKLLIVSEQGLGDTIQYMRYIPYLKNKGIDTYFCAQSNLHNLIKSSNIETNPLTPEEVPNDFNGKWLPLLSIPKYLSVNPNKVIISKRYIWSKEELVKKWAAKLNKSNKPIIGINWQGNPNLEVNFYKGRSLPLDKFSILADNSNIKFVSLQKGFGAEQLDQCSFRDKFVDCQQEINETWDFLETAAIIENCDLIITCDTSIAHLGGGMGQKVWLLLKKIPFWTWGLSGEETFWYPSIKLFRQNERDNWEEVIKRVYKELGSEGLL